MLSSPPFPCSIGRWLPKDRSLVKRWLAQQLKEIDENGPLSPSIATLADLISEDSYLARLSCDMFTQIPAAYIHDPTGKSQIRDFVTFLRLLNKVVKSGPQWFYLPNDQDAMQMIGFPINAMLDWPMGTLAGYMFFMDPQVNHQLRAILNSWGRYLTQPESTECLSRKDGWLDSDALRKLAAEGNNSRTNLTFQQLFECDPSHPTFGFKSWDEFFTRRFRPGVRPVDFPDNVQTPNDPTLAIVNACESAPTQFATNVKLQDVFWLKKQPYSLIDMLDRHPLAKRFAGGSVYQAYLNALSYHRWHAPVSGTVVSIKHVAGTYYSENLDQGFADPDGPDASASNRSQQYISAVATRGIIFIQADNPFIGLMAIVFIGMAEVSSCEFTVAEGDYLTKGEEIGMFHYGGSSHCLLFRPSTNLQAHNFVKSPPYGNVKSNNAVCSTLAVVSPPARLQKTSSCTLM